jgi:hypothetical protein
MIREIFHFPAHQNREASGFDSASIVFCTSFVAKDLYKESSSTIELEVFGTVLTAVVLVETELRKDENVDIFIAELFEREEEYGAEGDADDCSVVDVFG